MAIVITGASKGLGLALAKRLSAGDRTVYSFSRTAPDDPEIRHIYCDVSDPQSVEDAFAEFFGMEEKIDILVNNAGIGISGAAEYAAEEDMKEIFNVNLYGAIRCSQRAIPKMREQGCGKIIFVSSAAAIFPIPFQSFYAATKSAMNTFSEGLRMELKPFGIQVGTLLLCDTRTDFTKNRKKDERGVEFYGDRINGSVSVMEHDEQNGMSADRAAAKIVRYLERKRTKAFKAVGSQFKVPLPLLLFLNRILPRKWVLGIIYRVYGK
jgi:short-subunit dehydrogenase